MTGREYVQVVFGGLMAFVGIIRADVFNVGTAQELQTALTQAAGNGVADTVYMAAGYYIGNFNYNSAEAFDLTVCPENWAGTNTVTIDPDSLGRGLTINCSGAGNLTVQGIIFLRKCGDSARSALRVGTGGADILVDSCRFPAVNGAKGIGMEITSGRDATVRSCQLTRDGTSEGTGISAAGVTRTLLVANCSINGTAAKPGRGITVSVGNGTSVDIQYNTISSNAAPSSSVGGGIYIGGGGKVTLKGNTISGNSASSGGGIAAEGVNVALDVIENTIIGNSCGSQGGGVYDYCGIPGSVLTFVRNTITGNSSYQGGGIFSYSYAYSGGPSTRTVTLQGNAITKNRSTGSGGGGAYICVGSVFSIAFTAMDNTISDNSTVDGGGGVYLKDFGVYFNSTVAMTNNTFCRNSVTGGSKPHGGAVFVETIRSSILDRNTFLDNSTAGWGGAVYTSSANKTNQTLTIQGCVARRNSATANGGGAFALEGYDINLANNVIINNTQSGLSVGGGLALYPQGSLQMVNCTISGNSAVGDGGGVCLSLGGVTERVYVCNNIIWGNTSNGNGGDIKISGTGFRKEFVNNNASGLYGIWDLFTGNKDVAPLFADATNGDYHLTATSPCVNAGLNTATNLPATDADGDPRIANGTVDMGAYEFSNTDCHPADVNSNWVVEASEFTTYSDAWRNGQTWGTGTNVISADYVTRAGYLKEKGGVYHNDGAARPLRWKTGTP